MTNELVPGKRAFVRRGSIGFELPDQHEIEINELESGKRLVCLSTPAEGGIYRLDRIDEETDRVIVHVGDQLSSVGPPSWCDTVLESRGYPFP